eukprot:11156275-Lingulodinium_polyedra.AAC.1
MTPAQFWTNSPDLASAEGADTLRVQSYTRAFVSRIVLGCPSAIHKGLRPQPYLAYPVNARDRPRPDADWQKCFGSCGRAHKTDERHTRVPGECRWPLVESVRWQCPGCKARVP